MSMKLKFSGFPEVRGWPSRSLGGQNPGTLVPLSSSCCLHLSASGGMDVTLPPPKGWRASGRLVRCGLSP